MVPSIRRWDDALYSSEGSCTSPNIIMVIKSRKIIWAGHVARMREMKSS